MRTLVALCVVQTLCLLYLVINMPGENVVDDARTPMVETRSSGSTSATNPFAVPRRASSDGSGTVVQAGIDADTLRAIVREEVREEVRMLADELASGRGVEKERPAPGPIDQIVLAQNRAEVEKDIEYYKSVGSISPLEMRELEQQISTLDNAGRREMLGRLVRAMNSGEIDGRF